MSFEDELRETIQNALAAREQDEQDDRDFAARWEVLRRGLVLGVLQKAAAVMKASTLFGHTQGRIDNGGVILETQWSHDRDRFTNWLKFSPDHGKREVVCSASVANDVLKEPFSLTNLVESAVEGKIKTFADAIARGDKLRKKLSSP